LRGSYLVSLLCVTLCHLLNWVPFHFVPRVTWIYHYQPALVASFLQMAFIVDFVQRPLWYYYRGSHIPKVTKSCTIKVVPWLIASLFWTICFIAVTISFVYFSPFTYGTPIGHSEIMARRWRSEWW